MDAGKPLDDKFMGKTSENVDAGKPLDKKLMGKLPAATLKGTHLYNVDTGKPRDDEFMEKHFTPTKRKAECNLEFQRSNSSPVKQSKPSPPLVTPPTHVLCSHMSPGHDTSSELVPPSQFYSTDDEYSCYSDHDDSSEEAFLINPKKTTNTISTPDAIDLVVRQTVNSIFHKGSHFIDEITQQDLEPHVSSLTAAVSKYMKGKKNTFNLNDLNQICKTLESATPTRPFFQLICRWARKSKRNYHTDTFNTLLVMHDTIKASLISLPNEDGKSPSLIDDVLCRSKIFRIFPPTNYRGKLKFSYDAYVRKSAKNQKKQPKKPSTDSCVTRTAMALSLIHI